MDHHYKQRRFEAFTRGVTKGALGVALLSLTAASAPPEWGEGMVASDHDLASACGAEILEAGGNAADAAVATALCAGVVQPAGSGLGGGGFAVVTDGQSSAAYDFREVAPGAATADMYRTEDGGVSATASRKGGLAVAVPAESRGLGTLLRERGRLSPKAVAAPAIQLAKGGFRARTHLVKALAKAPLDGDVAREFEVDGEIASHGSWITRPALARTLKAWAKSGGEDLHTGKGAEALVAYANDKGGRLTAEDLAGYDVRTREPIEVRFRGYRLVSMPLPSSGGVVLAQMLQVLQHYELELYEQDSAPYLHLLTEVMKHAYADRANYLGDPDFVEVPLERILSEERIEEIREKIDLTQTFPPQYYGDLIEPVNDAGTQHISVMDSEGMAVALTTTINTSFGSGLVPSELGIVLNNEMDDFAAAPGVPNAYGLLGNEANAIAPGKRPLSSMTPTLILNEKNEVVMAVGASGGSTIISSVLQAILSVTVFNDDPQKAVSRPRIHHQWQPDVLFVEPEVAPEVRQALEALGHTVQVRPGFSSTQAVIRDPSGLYTGGSDPRKGGRPAGSWGSN